MDYKVVSSSVSDNVAKHVLRVMDGPQVIWQGLGLDLMIQFLPNLKNSHVQMLMTYPITNQI